MKKITIYEADGNNIRKIAQLLETVGIYFEEEEEVDQAMVSPTTADGAQEQAIEPENIDKLDPLRPFVKAQLSTKNQMILRNILAVVSSIAVVIAFILEKLGIL